MASLRVTRPGWVWLLIIAALLGIGLLRRINLLTLLVCPLLILWILNALLAGLRLGRLRGKRRIDGPVFAQAEFDVEVEVDNPQRARAAVRIEDNGPSHALAWFAPRLPGRATTTFHRKIALPKRGRYAWGALGASSSYPLGLVWRCVQLCDGEEIIVLPQRGRLHRGRLRQFLARHTVATEPIRRLPRQRLATEAEFHGLRTFRHGDSPRWIHWRTTARRGDLMVREFEDAPGEHLILVVDPWSPGVRRGAWSDEGDALVPLTERDAAIYAAHSARLEEAISFAATVCWEWCRQKDNRLVLAVAGKEPVVHSSSTDRAPAVRMLECLAVQEGNDTGHGTEIVDLLATLPLPPAPVLLVSVQGNRLADALRRGLNRPVVSLEAAGLTGLDFYERPAAGRAARVEHGPRTLIGG